MLSMIRTFADTRTHSLFQGNAVKGLPVPLQNKARKRLQYISYAARIEDLYFPPSNQFHALEGTDRYAVSVDMKWRITFRWEDGIADAKFEDYH